MSTKPFELKLKHSAVMVVAAPQGAVLAVVNGASSQSQFVLQLGLNSAQTLALVEALLGTLPIPMKVVPAEDANLDALFSMLNPEAPAEG